MKKLSIIVPVYNVEKYLGRCLGSLLEQDLSSSDYEIIIVNDGSTDNSLAVAKKHKEKYSNIKVISQKNEGLSGARNTGLRSAVGKYVIFVDSDDYIVPNCLNQLIAIVENKKLDFLRFNYHNVDENYHIISKKRNATYNVFYSDSVFTGSDFLTEQLGWACYAWQFLISKDFLLQNDLFFKEGIYFEDVEWLVRALLLAERVSSFDKQIYCYLQRTGSIMRSTDKKKQMKWYNDKLFIINFLKRLSAESDNKIFKKWVDGFVAIQVVSLFPYVKRNLPETKEMFLKLLYKEKYIPLKPYKFTLKQYRDICMINLSPHLFYMLKN